MALASVYSRLWFFKIIFAPKNVSECRSDELQTEKPKLAGPSKASIRLLIDLIAGAIEDWFQWMGIEVDDVCILRLELIKTVYISIAMQ